MIRAVRHSTLRLRPGVARAYERLHARLPDAVNRRLLDAGLLDWQIWREGRNLIHIIDTADGYDAMIERITRLGESSPEWDRLTNALVRSRPSRRDELRLVWRTTPTGQTSAAELASQGLKL